MTKFFVTGTDTNVGKTLVSAILTMKLKATYWKPIQSGTEEGLSDKEQVQQWVQLPDKHFLPSIYSLKASLSPDQAAKRENVKIELSNCSLPVLHESLIIEGAGGVRVPLNDHESILDLIKKFNLPVIIVARGTLGTINHTLLTIEALRHAKMTIHGIVFSGELNKENQQAIEYWGEVKTLFHVPVFRHIHHEVLQAWISSQPICMK
jgi:dethiobiotin synthetase